MRYLNCWDNKNFWGGQSVPPSPATSVKANAGLLHYFFHFSILCHLYFHPQCTRKKKYVFCNYQLLKYNICKYLCIKNTIFLKIDRNKIQKSFWSILQSISLSGCYRPWSSRIDYFWNNRLKNRLSSKSSMGKNNRFCCQLFLFLSIIIAKIIDKNKNNRQKIDYFCP